MGLEIEAKLRVESHDAIRQKLAELGAKPLGAVMETNHILDSADASLRSAGTGLRVRTSKPINGDAATTTLTYKGPVEDGRFKRRRELELEISSSAECLELLAALGFTSLMVFKKRRESYALGSARIELDELPSLGRFVEIEAPNEGTISSVQTELGLAALIHMDQSYVALIAAQHGQSGCDSFSDSSPTY